MKVGSLFAGIGGFDLAAERVGMTVAWQSENDPKASAVLEHHWPAKNYGDIHEIDQFRMPPRVDVLTGGFPCQDYSVAGTRSGLAGDRSALWWEFLRLINGFQPTWVVGENVPGLLSSRGGRDFQTIIESLTECGYGVAWAVLDAQYFGVAQRRRRVFIVGHSGGEPRPEILALSEGVYGHPEPRRETGERTAPTLAARTRGGGGLGTDTELDGGLITAETATSLKASGSYDHVGDEARLVAFAQNQRDEVRNLDDKAGALAAEPGIKQQTYLLQGGGRTSQGSQGSGWKVEESFTLNTTDEHGIANHAGVRRLTPLECERLQGFPDNWTDIPGNSDTQRYRQLGNAVAVPVVEWILRNIKEAA